jgi:hypothetical protein
MSLSSSVLDRMSLQQDWITVQADPINFIQGIFMKISHLLLASIALTLTAVNANAAVTATATFQTAVNSEIVGDGSFSGIDANNDGNIQFNELTSFSWQLNNNCHTTLLPSNVSNGDCRTYLTNFGTYNYQTNTWNSYLTPAKGTIYHSYTSSFDPLSPSGLHGILQESFTVSTSLVSVSAPVPEPESYAMLLAGLGVVGMMGRRRNNSKKAA